MKKLIFLAFIFMIAKSYAQMDNLSNLSAEWLRTGARNAATNGTDIAAYNPAGLTKLEKGIHINLSNQSLFRSPSHSYDLGLGEGTKTFTQDGSDPFIPALYFAVNREKLAWFGGIYISGGGATMNYSSGSITTDLISLQALYSAGGAYMTTSNQSLKASSAYFTYMAGAAYSVSKSFSFSFALRDVSGKNKGESGITLTSSPIDLPDQPLALDYEETANGIGAVVGLNFSLGEKLDIAARYESKVKLDFKTKKITDDFGIITDGEKNRRDLPAVIALGISLQASQAIRAYFDYNYYFQEDADWGKSTAATNEQPFSTLAGNATGIGAGLECKVTEKFTASFGGGYTDYKFNDKAGYYTQLGTFEVVHDDNINFNTGFAYDILKRLRINAGYMHTFWSKDQNVKALLVQPLDVDVKTNNSLDAFALGIELRF